jgi:protein-tyrosine phosphatase
MVFRRYGPQRDAEQPDRPAEPLKLTLAGQIRPYPGDPPAHRRGARGGLDESIAVQRRHRLRNTEGQAGVVQPAQQAMLGAHLYLGYARGPVSYPDPMAAGSASRIIGWEGFANARDLGGLPTRDGRVTRSGAFIRSGDLRFVTSAGWQMATAAGLRTIVDLRNDDEIRPRAGERPAGSAPFAVAAPAAGPPASMDRVEVALDDIADTEFWQFLTRERLDGTPLYFRPFLERKPERCAAAVTALAETGPGGVLFHCWAGRDRTGLITLLLLALAGVEPEAIADDYELSAAPVKALLTAMGQPDQGPGIEADLAARDTSAADAILATLDGFDAETYLLTAGVSATSLAVIRGRLLD